MNESALDHTGRKDDQEKPMLDLIPPRMELEVGHVLTFGAIKYSPDNWRHVPDARRRYLAAAMRHLNALRAGDLLDPESGRHHAAHAATCLMFIGELDLEQMNPAPGVELPPLKAMS